MTQVTTPHNSNTCLNVHAVLGRSIVVYGTGAQSGQLLGCANIEPSLVAEEEISFPKNGTNPDDIDRWMLFGAVTIL